MTIPPPPTTAPSTGPIIGIAVNPNPTTALPLTTPASAAESRIPAADRPNRMASTIPRLGPAATAAVPTTAACHAATASAETTTPTTGFGVEPRTTVPVSTSSIPNRPSAAPTGSVVPAMSTVPRAPVVPMTTQVPNLETDGSGSRASVTTYPTIATTRIGAAAAASTRSAPTAIDPAESVPPVAAGRLRSAPTAVTTSCPASIRASTAVCRCIEPEWPPSRI